MPEEIPVTFTYQGKEYKGSFSRVAGGGSTALFHLTVDKRHWGQLFYGRDKWFFFSNPMPELSELAEEFGMVVMGWYQ